MPRKFRDLTEIWISLLEAPSFRQVPILRGNPENGKGLRVNVGSGPCRSQVLIHSVAG